MKPQMKRLIKKCEEFYICAEYGDKNVIGIEYPNSRLTMYQYIVSGSTSFNRIEGDKLIQRSGGCERCCARGEPRAERVVGSEAEPPAVVREERVV